MSWLSSQYLYADSSAKDWFRNKKRIVWGVQIYLDYNISQEDNWKERT